MTFKNAFCRERNCLVDDFVEKVFWQCLYPHAWPLAWIMRLLLMRRFFQSDFELITSVGESSSMEEVLADISAFRSNPRWRGGLLRRAFRIRVSGKRLVALAFAVFKSRSVNEPAYP
jgi:hypothetical protein